MKKKYELIKYAYDNYPKGTVARFKSAPNVDHVSDGRFKILDVNHDGNIGVFSGSGLNCFFHDGEWADPVAPSILSGKCAIQVSNEREFKLLMEHYECKGWTWNGGDKPTVYVKISYPNNIEYSDSFCHSIDNLGENYKIITFLNYANKVGIDVPLFFCKSEDGTDLYQFDTCFTVVVENGFARFGNSSGWKIYKDEPDKPNMKYFSTKESAEAWIAENNKPKFTDVKLHGTQDYALVYKDRIEVNSGQLTITIKPSDLEDMLHAYKSLTQ